MVLLLTLTTVLVLVLAMIIMLRAVTRRRSLTWSRSRVWKTAFGVWRRRAAASRHWRPLIKSRTLVRTTACESWRNSWRRCLMSGGPTVRTQGQQQRSGSLLASSERRRRRGIKSRFGERTRSTRAEVLRWTWPQDYYDYGGTRQESNNAPMHLSALSNFAAYARPLFIKDPLMQPLSWGDLVSAHSPLIYSHITLDPILSSPMGPLLSPSDGVYDGEDGQQDEDEYLGGGGGGEDGRHDEGEELVPPVRRPSNRSRGHCC